jgi:ribosomal protein S6--L-glutamate ligase
MTDCPDYINESIDECIDFSSEVAVSIGILYESDEWSNRRLKELIIKNGIAAEMIFMEDFRLERHRPFPHSLYINRVFPSTDMRGHFTSLGKTASLLQILEKQNIPVINSYRAFLYDCSKFKTYNLLKENRFLIPGFIFVNPDNTGAGRALSSALDAAAAGNKPAFPLVLKRDCGGRSYDLKMIMNPPDLQKIEKNIKTNTTSLKWVMQEFIDPVKGFTTRVEVIDNQVMTVLKRFLGKEGISSYAVGSRYELYPDCPAKILEDSVKALKILDIEMGSLDFIENRKGMYYLIDVNATSNFTPDYIPLLGFDPIEKMAGYIIDKYKANVTGQPSFIFNG